MTRRSPRRRSATSSRTSCRAGRSRTPAASAWAGSGRSPRAWWPSLACSSSWCSRPCGSPRSTGTLHRKTPMSDAHAGPTPGDPEEGQVSGPQAETGDEPPGVPRRVIGTPSPAQARMLLAETAPGSTAGLPAQRPRELPADPQDLRAAKTAEKVVAACFMIAGLAGCAFIASYFIFQVHSVVGVQHSNLALGLSMGLTFLFMGIGTVIWVRQLMPVVEITEQRHPLRSDEADREAFAETFAEGAEASQFVKRPIL